MTPPFRLLDIPAIDSPDDAEHGWKYEAVHRLAIANRLVVQGNTDQVPSVQSFIADRASQLYQEQQWVLAVQGPQDAPQEVGWAWVGLPIYEDLDKAQIQMVVHPEMRCRGIGSALLAWGEDLIAQAGRTLIFSGATYGTSDDHEPYLITEQGTTAPIEAPCVCFPRKRGYEVAQTERRSVLTVPLEADLAGRLMAQTEPYTSDYLLHTWFCEIPEEWKDSFVRLKETFSVDTPQGTVEFDQEVWNRDRVDRMVQEILDQGDVFLMTVAEHIASGELAGFTELRWPRESGGEAASQWFTLVSREHRGHRLGMWMKLVNTEELTIRRPEIRRVHTENAQENAHMLAINIAMGFQPNGGIALMTKNLS